MRILTIGSLNLDHVYRVPHFVRPGETLASAAYQCGPGGKGLNQSVAAARAGARVAHAGCIGSDGDRLLKVLEGSGVDTSHIRRIPDATGHAIIQVNDSGENAILLHAGANHRVDVEMAHEWFNGVGPGDWLLLQNETSAVPELIREAQKRQLTVVLNPAPMSKAVHDYPLDLVDLMVLNQTEAVELSGEEDEEAALSVLVTRYPGTEFVLTLGEKGCRYRHGDKECIFPAERVEAVDTTAAGDCFVGYLVAALAEGLDRPSALKLATRAAALTVQRPGAADSIPWRRELTRG
ncbi:MAG: ribokinase [Kiritimatiellae bacterium]|jgi:ribokinase|nr:ribokinase [Kiritimatiellia bacterium]